MDTSPVISTPSSPGRKTPSGSKPRTPLQERTQSQTNEDSGRIGRDGRYDHKQFDVFSSTPFPTKPQHILLPSTIRKQRSFRGIENDLPQFFGRSQPDVSHQQPAVAGGEPAPEESRGRRAPVLQLKRSVSTLRDMYEAQADKSRPSTSASSGLRPGTASSRLRSASSSEGLSNRHAWETLHKISADDMALLPTLSQSSLDKTPSGSSFAARVKHNQLSSSPNYQTFGSSSPKMAVFRDSQLPAFDPFEGSSSSGLAATSSSSPNFVRLGRSSSIVETLDTEQSSSSPNYVKIGTSSPGVRTSSSPTPSVASNGSRKRKREEAEAAQSFSHRMRPFKSSPPYIAPVASSSQPSLKSPDSLILPSSPPQPESLRSQSVGTSSPVYRLPGVSRHTSGSSSSSSTHASLQAALSSSPMPPIQYPVIRAPSAAGASLSIPKRVTRRGSNEAGTQWTSRLSPVPSEWDEGTSRAGSRKSNHTDEVLYSDSINPEATGNESQVRIIPVSEDDEHEAIDELRALPRGNHAFRTPPLVPVRTNSLYGTSSSSSGSANQSQSRLNSIRTSIDFKLGSMKSFTHSRQNSFMSGSIRPNSAGSQTNGTVVPTWARRYYSGLYRDSFQYLYPTPNHSAAQLQLPTTQNPLQRFSSSTSRLSQQGADTVASRDSRRSWQSIRESLRSSMLEFVPSVLLPKSRPRLEVRKSHLTAGIGPLVSNPVHPGAVHTRLEPHRETSTIRRISDNLPPVDPRAHWNGITDEQSIALEDTHAGSSRHPHQQYFQNRRSAESESVYYDATSGQFVTRPRFIDVPNLHHDRRLNTGSSKSRGFGFPFNQKPKWRVPSVYTDSDRPSWFRIDLRDAQVTCFIAGFVFPLTWFVAACLRLPQRPESFGDIEKAIHDQQIGDADEIEEMDIVARLRLERHVKGVEELKWQNARWWRRMNRWMCIVGLVVVVLAVILAVIGTKNNW